jgi:hypothetical protein
LLHRAHDVSDSLHLLHRLTFTRGSEALDFVRTLRELSGAPLRGEPTDSGPILIYGARIVTPDAPAELYVSVGALALAYALGMEGLARRSIPWTTPAGMTPELPADMALLFTGEVVSERVVR